MPEPTPADRLNQITQQGLCVGCGLCQDIAGRDVIRCTLVENGYERPVVVGDLDHATVDVIYAACPGTRVTGLPGDLIGEATVDLVWGPWRRIVRAWAARPYVRHAGSTAGVLTALGMHLLDTGRVNAILHAGPSADQPSFGEARISRSPEEVLAAAGSRYGPTAVLTRLGEALDAFPRLAVIAKPCDLSAVRLQARHDPRIGEQVRYCLALVCGGFMAPEGMAERMEQFGLDPGEVTGVRYRGHGCPGSTRFERGRRLPVEVTYLDFWGDDESKWMLPYRCKICPDGTAEAADLAAADTWPGGTPTAARLDGDPGTNVVVVRTEAGLDLLDDAVASGHLAIGDEATIEELDLWQPHQVAKKHAAWARQAGRRRAGVIPIELEGLRATELARSRPFAELREQVRGSMLRVRDGRADEPVPVVAPRRRGPGTPPYPPGGP